MHKILLKLGRVEEVDGKKRVISKEERFTISDTSKDFHAAFCIVPQAFLETGGKTSIKGQEFVCFPANKADVFNNLKKGAQSITLKDAAFVLGQLGVSSKSVMLDAGSGSGASACFFSQFVKEVVSYDVSEENISVAKKNAARFQSENIIFKEGSVYTDVSEEQFDAIFLDVPEPQQALSMITQKLKIGNLACIYSPNLTQLKEVIAQLPEALHHEKTVEVNERPWSLKNQTCKPIAPDIAHTAFLCFLRRIL
ncbi:MAG: methyltransferase domain-containing protein [Candidatus Woesearchaeota archaeon]|nr:MAG: methyltransferase domain-containing protein [Candidatus Woesearchaeota archaeon]